MADLFYLIGPSGAGKDSLIAYARTNMAGCPPLVFAHRYITRPADSGGENHVALSEREFRCRREQGCFSLCWESHGFWYGLGREVEMWLGSGLRVVGNGSRGALADAVRAFPRLRPVLIRAAPETIAERLRRRGRESPAEIEERLARTRAFGEPDHPSLVVIDNDGSLEVAGQALIRLLGAGPSSPPGGSDRAPAGPVRTADPADSR
jgi:ribose 1,5-bisphosphokinase